MNYVNVGYDSTNHYAISTQKGYTLIDVGMPGTTKKFLYTLSRNSINVKNISSVMVTHFHPDHCGIVQDLQQIGTELIISDTQKTLLQDANKELKMFLGFKEMIFKPNNIIIENDKDMFLSKVGIPGYIIHTPGHSNDSISIVIEGLGIFIGDLPFCGNNEFEKEKMIEKSWEEIRSTGEKMIFPAHAKCFEL